MIYKYDIFRSSHLHLCYVSAWHTTQMTLSGDDDDNITKFLKENGDSTIVKQPCQPFLAFMVRHEIDRLCDSQKIEWVLKRKPGSQNQQHLDFVPYLALFIMKPTNLQTQKYVWVC